MNPYKILIKSYFKQLLGINRLRHTQSKTEKIKMIIMGALILYAVVAFISLAIFYASMLANGLDAIGGLKFLPLLALILLCLVIVVFSTYSIQGSLFAAKDYSLLFSLPIKPVAILVSKLCFTYVMNCLLTAAFFIPIIVMYYLKVACSPLVFLLTLLAVPFIPLLPTLLATFLAYGTSFFASRSKKHSSGIILFLMITLTIAGIAVQFNANKLLPLLLTHREVILESIQRFYPPAYYLTTALTDLDIVALLWFIICSIIPTLVVLMLLSKGLKKIVAGLGETHQTAQFKLGALKTRSVLKTLYVKELKRFFASPIYVMNTSIGMLLVVVLAVLSSFFSPAQLETLLEIPNMQPYIVALLVVILAGSSALTFTSAISISIEGKNLWIVKSSPITPLTLFTSKILVNLTVCLPSILLASLLFTFNFKLSFIDWMYLLVIPSLYAGLTATSGILINLLFPKLNWTSETAVVKQSASSMIAAFWGMSLIAIPVGLFILLKPHQLNLFFLGVIIVLTLLNITSFHLLKTAGVKQFNKLH